MTEEIKDEEVKLEDLSVEDIKAKAEELEAKLKDNKDEPENDISKEKQIKTDQIGRVLKAQKKLEALKTSEIETNKEEAPQEKGLTEAEVDRIIFLKTKKSEFPENSEAFKKIEEYREKGLITSFDEYENNVGLKAELEDIKSKQEAQNVIDANEDDSKLLQTKNDIYEANRGKEPQDDYSKKIVAEKGLENEGFKEY